MTLTLAQQRLANEAKWWISHEALMDYAQIRPVPLAQIKAHQKCKTDCSGSVYGIFHALGFDDPTGGEYTSQDIVYTGTLLTANTRLPSGAEWRVGDLAIFANGENTVHVALVIAEAADPLLFSHGQDRGPIAINLSTERLYHASHGAATVHHVRPDLPADQKARVPRWRVTTGSGAVLGRTRTPRLWTLRHHPFKGHAAVHYRKTDQ